METIKLTRPTGLQNLALVKLVRDYTTSSDHHRGFGIHVVSKYYVISDRNDKPFSNEFKTAIDAIMAIDTYIDKEVV